MINSEDVRKRLINFIIGEGITQLFICNKCGIATSSLSKFKNNTYRLKREELRILSEFLSSRGY